jgi:hypothetical protein
MEVLPVGWVVQIQVFLPIPMDGLRWSRLAQMTLSSVPLSRPLTQCRFLQTVALLGAVVSSQIQHRQILR